MTAALRRPERVPALKEMLDQYLPGRVVDLGSGTAFASLIAAEAGWSVTSVDTRTDRWPEPRPEGIEWQTGDVRTTSLESYDLVLCLGLFYHLTVEDQVDLLSRLECPMILDTHVGRRAGSQHPLTDSVRLGYAGSDYPEPDDSNPLSSWGNETSFWPTVESLVQMVEDQGLYADVGPWTDVDRLFIHVKEGK